MKKKTTETMEKDQGEALQEQIQTLQQHVERAAARQKDLEDELIKLWALPDPRVQKEPKLYKKPFNGKGNGREWLLHWERYCELNSLEDVKKVKHFVCALEDRAHIWWEQKKSKLENTRWEEVKEAFFKHFSPQ